MKTLKLEWKEFKINGKMVEANLKALLPSAGIAVSENYAYEVHMNDDVSEEDEQAIKDHWDAIDEESAESTSWKSRDELKAEAEAAIASAKASAKAKFILMGLSEEEAEAIVKG